MITTKNKDAVLNTMPHYTDSRFKTAQTVFGDNPNNPYGHDHLSYDYSDRLWEWDYDKAEKATRIANESGSKQRTCRWYEVYLSAYFERPTVIDHIMAGFNVSNGYPYAVFGYRHTDETTTN